MEPVTKPCTAGAQCEKATIAMDASSEQGEQRVVDSYIVENLLIMLPVIALCAVGIILGALWLDRR